MIRFIKCHGKIREGQICFPARDYLAFIAIDYRDVTRVGNIDENSATLFLQLKSFRMCAEFNGADLFPIGGINNGNASAPKSDIDFLTRFIITNIVGVIFKTQFPNHLERFSIVYLANTAFVIGNKQTIQFRGISDSLRCGETGDRVDSLAFTQIEHFDGVIAKRTNKQPFAVRIEREMVDPSFDTRQWERLL